MLVWAVTWSYCSLLLCVSGGSEESRETWFQAQWHDRRNSWHACLSAASCRPSWLWCRHISTARCHCLTIPSNYLVFEGYYLFFYLFYWKLQLNLANLNLIILHSQSQIIYLFMIYFLQDTISTPCSDIPVTPVNCGNWKVKCCSNFGASITVSTPVLY